MAAAGSLAATAPGRGRRVRARLAARPTQRAGVLFGFGGVWRAPPVQTGLGVRQLFGQRVQRLAAGGAVGQQLSARLGA